MPLLLSALCNLDSLFLSPPHGWLFLLDLHQQQLGEDRQVWVHFLASCSHSPPTAMFPDETVTNPKPVCDCFHSCSYFPISCHIFTVLLALCVLLCPPPPGLHINIHFQPLTASGGWGNSYHPTHLSPFLLPCCGFVVQFLCLHVSCFSLNKKKNKKARCKQWRHLVFSCVLPKLSITKGVTALRLKDAP